MVTLRTLSIWLAIALCSTTVSAQVWERVALPGQFAQGYYLDVFFLPSNPQYGWACGFNGYVVRTTNGGATWQGSVVPFNGRAGGHLESVHFVDQLNGYASGPCGVFRSTDGGVTWTDVTPTFPNEAPWGCYFLSATTGVVLGGGCVGSQNFFRTTNGGQSWSLFQSNQPSSGLTDALLYADGSGYAVSSGLLWQTTDGGSSWSVVASTGPNYWNEEITRRGSSLLIPWAGSNCSGQGNGGGGRFSTDGGQTWRSYSTGVPMFGAFLHDAQRGWICGYARQVWYTSDAGQNWQYRGCGTDGDLDDIWMIDDTTGFVVGEGIYRYARAQRSASKTTLDFGSLCPPVLRYDTLYVRNRSWNATTVRLSLSGNNAGAFAIVQPTWQTAAVPSCDSLMIVVRYQPTSDSVHTGALVAEFPSGETVTVTLRGERIGRTVSVRDTLVEVVGVPAGEVVSLSLLVDNRSGIAAQVSAVTPIGGSTFLLESAPPLSIPPGGGTLRFRFVPPDTGWYSARFRIRTEPCSRDTTVTLRVYARSPIVAARAPIWNSACGGAALDSVLVTNTGNSDLLISAMGIEPLGAPMTIVGTSRGMLPIVVPPQESLWVYVRFDGYGSGTAMLVIDHNDGTLVRNVARPLRVTLAYGSARPTWQRSPAVLDFGTLCVGESRVLFADVANTGSIPIDLSPQASASFAVTTNRLTLAPTARAQVGVSFAPSGAGVWSGVLVLAIEPCDLADTIALRGRAETAALAFDTSPVNVAVRVGEQRRVPIVVRSVGSAPARIVRLRLVPADPQWRLQLPSLPLVLAPAASDTLWLEIAAGSSPMVLSGQLCVEADSMCPVVECVELRCSVEPLQFHRLELDPSALAFSPQRCQPLRQRQSVTIANTGTFAEAITAARIVPSDAPFAVVSPPLPVTVEPGQNVRIEIEYAPTAEGVHTAVLELESPDAWAAPVQVMLSGSFARVTTTLDPQRTDRGILEPCSPLQEIAVTFRARGMLGDTLQLVAEPSSPGWRLVPTVRRIEIAPNDSATVVLMLDPSQATVALPSADRFVWESRVCPAQVTTVVEYVVLRSRLTYAPTELRWNGAMQNAAVGGKIEVHNPSPIDRTIIAAEIVPIVGTADATVRTALPLRIGSGERQWLDVEIVPRQEGDYRAVLRLVERSACTDTAELTLAATVTRELYRARLSMHRHAGLVGDTIGVPVVLTTRDSSADALWRADPEEIGFEVQYDPFVLDALGAESPRGIALPVERELGIVRVRVPRQSARLLGASDTIAILHFLGLQSPPLRSELHFSRSWATTPKPYLIEHDDGAVVLDACVPWMKVVFGEGVQFRVVPNPVVAGENATLVVESKRAELIVCELFDERGGIVRRWKFSADNQHSEMLALPSSGVYYLRAESSASGAHVILPIVVLR
jgi:photosystem II stability/assembly factor-like uncharacterized protein